MRPPSATPLLWLAITVEEMQVPRRLAEQVWISLVASHYTQPTSLRQWTLVQPYVAVRHFWQQMTPQELVAVIEALVHEGRLARSLASMFEEYVLTWTDAQGQWKQP